MPDRTLEYHKSSDLKLYAKNARTHSQKQIRQIADSIETFGFTNPILIDDERTILAGHGRLAAAKLLRLDSVPCMRVEHMTSAQKRAYALADNKLALNAGWDEEVLASELQSLLDVDLDFDIDVMGFSATEIDVLIESVDVAEDGDPNDDVIPPLNDHSRRCQPGQLWKLGSHRLLCGDALDPLNVSELMGREKARMVFTDPPYNVPINGHVGGSGKTQHPEFAMACGEMSVAQFTAFLTTAFENMCRHSIDGSIHFVCMDWRHMQEILTAGMGTYSEFKNLIAWVKDNGGMGTFYRSRHELIFAFKNGTAPHTNTFELGQNGRYRTNVWEYRGVNTLKTGRMDELTLHPTVKPIQMIADAIKDVSGRGDLILDLFGGSGSTLIAAQKTGRRAYICELDPIYCDRIIQRWEQYANDDAELIELHPSEYALKEECVA